MTDGMQQKNDALQCDDAVSSETYLVAQDIFAVDGQLARWTARARTLMQRAAEFIRSGSDRRLAKSDVIDTLALDLMFHYMDSIPQTMSKFHRDLLRAAIVRVCWEQAAKCIVRTIDEVPLSTLRQDAAQAQRLERVRMTTLAKRTT